MASTLGLETELCTRENKQTHCTFPHVAPMPQGSWMEEGEPEPTGTQFSKQGNIKTLCSWAEN